MSNRINKNQKGKQHTNNNIPQPLCQATKLHMKDASRNRLSLSKRKKRQEVRERLMNGEILNGPDGVLTQVAFASPRHQYKLH